MGAVSSTQAASAVTSSEYAGTTDLGSGTAEPVAKCPVINKVEPSSDCEGCSSGQNKLKSGGCPMPKDKNVHKIAMIGGCPMEQGKGDGSIVYYSECPAALGEQREKIARGELDPRNMVGFA